MANSSIQRYLAQILNAIYGRDVRSAIHDAISQCYDDVSSAKTIAENKVNELEGLVDDVDTAITNANEATSDAIAATNNMNTMLNSSSSTLNRAIKNANDTSTAMQTMLTSSSSALNVAIQNAIDNADLAQNKAAYAEGKGDYAEEKGDYALAQGDALNTMLTSSSSTLNQAIALANQKASYANTQGAYAKAQGDALNDMLTESSSTLNQAITLANNKASYANTQGAYAAEQGGRAETAANNISTIINTTWPPIQTRTEQAAGRAEDAASLIENLTVTSEDASPSTSASATVSTVSGHYNVHFVLRQGAQGAPFMVKGQAYATVTDLQNGVTNPSVGDQYNVGTAVPYDIYRWTGSSWENQGKIGSNMIEITNNEIDNIIAGQTVDGQNKALGVTGVGYLHNTVISGELSNKVDKVSGKGLSTNDFTNTYKTSLDSIPAQITALSNNKVDKVSGKGLSTNDYTSEEKVKLAGIAEGATKVTVAASLSSTSKNPVQSKVIATALEGKVDKENGKSLSTNDFTDAYKTILDNYTVDSSLSTTSTNPVQNKVVTAAINNAGGSVKFTNKPVASWANDTSTYPDFPKKGTVSCNGVTPSMFVSVVFNVEDAMSGNFAPVAETGQDVVYIWATDSQASSFRIPTIVAFK